MAAPSKGDDSYTYADYLTWPDDERWELIDGVAYDMTPAPLRNHQDVCGEIFRQIATIVRTTALKVYIAPFDVRFPTDGPIVSVVQPDICVIADLTKLDERGCRGAPDFIIEVVSPSTASKDIIRKAALYEREGVREYWIVHPTDELVYLRRLRDDGSFSPIVIKEAKGEITIEVLPELTVDFDLVFTD